MRVSSIEKGKYPHPFVAFLAVPCYHCAKPACVSACPVDAITKREEDGIVTVNREACLGRDDCQFCLDACRYKAPQFGAEDGAKMQKCDFCLDRWAEGKPPICVAGCPMRAMDAGPEEEMETKHGRICQAVGFSYDDKTRPAVVFKPRVQGTLERV
jgi:anaerobic dimethyl sulfoxide reductase subunit B (iron-sulfur subunit)